MPWSRECSRIVTAKKAAAGLCLTALLASGDMPHNPSRVPLIVSETSSGNGSGGSAATFVGAETNLPDLTDLLLAVSPIILTPAAAAAASEDDEEEDNCGLHGYSEDEEENEEKKGRVFGTVPQIPENLGQLGEEYAFRWLQKQPWVVPGSVLWLNESAESSFSHDLECEPCEAPGHGRRHVEVKTRWRRFRKAGATKAQRARLLDPEDDYLLLIIGYFENLFPSSGRDSSPPQIRLLPNVRWECKEVTCGGWCEKNTFGWSVAEQKATGASRPMLELAPLLCKGCQRKLDSSPGGTVHNCKDCKKPWIFKERERRVFKKKGFFCASCRTAKNKSGAIDEQAIWLALFHTG